MYRKATDFCILILYPDVVFSSFIGSNSCFLSLFIYFFLFSESLGFSMYSVNRQQIVTVLLLFFQFECLLFLFLV